MKRIKYLLLSILCLLCFIHISYATETTQNGGSSWTGSESSWTGSTSYQNGWSEWSTSVPTSSQYAREVVYLAPDNWSNESCGSEQSEITSCTGSDCSVRKYTGANVSYYRRDNCQETYSCGSWDNGSHGSYPDRCSGRINYNKPINGWCAIPSYAGSCAGSYAGNCDGITYTQQCYWIEWQSVSTSTSCSCGGGTQSTDAGCGSTVTGYCYETSSSFSEDKSNWKTSLSSAGGYAKKIYVYSYPLNINIKYDGNGANKLCEVWNENGTNTYNSNTHIVYENGNPQCSTNFTDETMDNSTLSYIEGGNLSKNKYNKIGYDFIGWVTSKSNANWQLVENGIVTPFEDQEAIASNNALIAAHNPGDTVTLYAVWKPHEYNVTYRTLCGTNTNLGTYKYGEGLTLSPINTSTCVGDNEDTIFLGWYEDNIYTKYLANIPATYYKDLILYAKLGQARYYNYNERGWRKLSSQTNNVQTLTFNIYEPSARLSGPDPYDGVYSNYELVGLVSFSGEEGMTWAQWLASDYNTWKTITDAYGSHQIKFDSSANLIVKDQYTNEEALGAMIQSDEMPFVELTDTIDFAHTYNVAH